MVKKIAAVILACILCLFLSTTAFAADVPQKVLNLTSSVFCIETSADDGMYYGTGFHVASGMDGSYLITNYHVVEPNTEAVAVYVDENGPVPAEVVRYSEQYDLALLKLQDSVKVPVMKFSREAKQGASVYAIGFPIAADSLSSSAARLGEEATITDGVISNFRTMQIVSYGPEVSLLQITAEINGGNSGGPLVNAAGHIVGVNTFGVTDAQGIFGSLGVPEVIEFAGSNGIALEFAEARPIPAWMWLIAVAVLIIIAAVLGFVLFSRKSKRGFLNAYPVPAMSEGPYYAEPYYQNPGTYAGPDGFDFSAQYHTPVKQPKAPVWIIPVAAAALVVSVAAYVMFNLFSVKTAIKKGDFTAADTYLDNISVAASLLKTERAYADAGLLLESGQMEEAMKLFESLGSAYSAQDMAEEASYRTAAVLANMNEFDEAITRFEALGAYKNSEKLIDEITVRKAYFNITNGNIDAGFDILETLKSEGYEDIDKILLDANYQCALALIASEAYYDAYGYMKAAAGYLDADAIITELTDILYDQALDYYYDRDYENAYLYFHLIHGYLDSASFDVLSYVHYYYASEQSVEFLYTDTETLVWDHLVPILDFEDTAIVLTMYDALATEFLTGTWFSDSNYFSIDEYGDVDTDLPFPSYAAYYTISNGFFQVYNDETEPESIWEIYVATYNTIYIYVYEFGDTYAFYRYS
jgi:predicted negative regulator of RcsB-dependent stress response